MKLRVKIASRFWQRTQGLSGLKKWPDYDGLVLKFICPGFWPIWMRGMRMAIDVLWLRQGKIVGLRENISPANPYTLYFPRHCGDSCLELPAGTIQKLNLSVGTRITFQNVDLDV